MLSTGLALLLGAGLAPGSFAIDRTASTVRYHVVHPLHLVDGEAFDLEGGAELGPDGVIHVVVRAPVAAFRSGHAERDDRARDALDAGRFPLVTFRALGRLEVGLEPPLQLPLDGEVELHGMRRPLRVPVSLAAQPNGDLVARASFDVSLEAFGIARPTLLLVKVDDVCRIDVYLRLRRDDDEAGPGDEARRRRRAEARL